MRARVVASTLFFAVSFLASCSGFETGSPSAPLTAVVESRAVGGTQSNTDQPLGADPTEWITAFRAELVTGQSGAGRPEVPWHSELRLRNGTRLLLATSAEPEIRFPLGFGLPLAQILRDIPEEWRSASVVSSFDRSDLVGDGIIRTTVEYSVGGKAVAPPRRLYALSLSVRAPEGEQSASAGDLATLVPDARAWLQVPPGRSARTERFSYLVPVDSTVHHATALLVGPAVGVRLTDVTEGKVLWEENATPDRSRPGPVRIPPYRSESGFPIYRDHEYEVEVRFDEPGDATTHGAALLYLYYHPSDDREFSYPYPPPEEPPGA